MELQFTKEIKNNWLTALKSGNFQQFRGRLRNPQNHSEMCCIGVLCTVLTNFKIDVDGYSKREDPTVYTWLEERITKSKTRDLWQTNDQSYKDGKRDYSEVIPLIEKLPTID